VNTEVIFITNHDQLKTAWEIRKKVFVDEQKCPEEIEWEYEEESTHFLAITNTIPSGTARWRETNNGIKLERFAVLQEFRKYGVGTALLQKILEDVLPKQKTIYLHAQLSAKDFYLKNGFVPFGEHFWEADIEHVKMIYDTNNKK
jgi:predicted GNAT family N-acyltransferase